VFAGVAGVPAAVPSFFFAIGLPRSLNAFEEE